MEKSNSQKVKLKEKNTHKPLLKTKMFFVSCHVILLSYHLAFWLRANVKEQRNRPEVMGTLFNARRGKLHITHTDMLH